MKNTFNEFEKSKKITLFLSHTQTKDFLKKIGFDIDEDGYIIEKESKKRVLTKSGEEINIFKDETFGIVGGSLEFFKDIVEYSQILTEKGSIKVIPQEDEQ